MIYIYRGSETPVSTEIHLFPLLCVDFAIPSIHILPPNTKQNKSVWIRSLSLYYYILSMTGCESDRISLPNHKLMLNFNQWYVKCTAQLRKPSSSWILKLIFCASSGPCGLTGRISGEWPDQRRLGDYVDTRHRGIAGARQTDQQSPTTHCTISPSGIIKST